MVLLPDIGEAIASGGLADALLEGVPSARRVSFVGRRHPDHAAQVDEVLLRRGALGSLAPGPLGRELGRDHSASIAARTLAAWDGAAKSGRSKKLGWMDGRHQAVSDDRRGSDRVVGKSVVVEKTLQALMERHLEEFLGVRFLASEYQTGKTHGGRIDSLGIDENNSPVIIEYKRATNENVINQGLFYMDWLLDHKAEFTLLAMSRLGPDIEKKIEWPGTRLICIASDFTKYDEHAVQQINRNIELIRYLRFGEDLLLLEQVNAVTAPETGAASAPKGPYIYTTVTELLSKAPPDLRDLHGALDSFLLALGDDVQLKVTHFYFAYRRIKNFACVEVHPKTKDMRVFLKVEPTLDIIEDGFTRDVRQIGHYGTGDLEVTMRSLGDLERAKPLILRSYEAS